MKHYILPNYAFNTAKMKSKKNCIECSKEFMSTGTSRCTDCRLARRKATTDASNKRIKERRAVDKNLA